MDGLRIVTACHDGRLLAGSADDPAERVVAPADASAGAVVTALTARDGRTVAGYNDGRVAAWGADGAPIGAWTVGRGPIADVALDAGDRLAVLPSRGDVGIVHLAAGWRTNSVPRRDAAVAVRWDADGALAVLDPQIEERWSIPRSRLPHVVPLDGGASGADLQGGTLAVATGAGTVATVDLAAGTVRRFRWQEGVIKAIALDPTGSRLVAEDLGLPGLKVIDARTGEIEATLPRSPCRRLWWTADGIDAIGFDGARATWTWPPASPDLAADRIDDRSSWMAGNPDGRAAGSPPSIRAGDLYRLAASGPQLLAADTNAHYVAAVGADLVLASRRRLVRIAPDGHTVATQPIPDGATALAGSPDGRWIAVGAKSGEVSVYDARLSSLVASLPGHDQPVVGIVFDEAGARLATASWDRTVRLWRTRAFGLDPAAAAAEIAAGWGRTIGDAIPPAP